MEKYLIPWIVSNVIALLLLGVSWRWFNAGRLAFGLIFLAAGLFNGYTAIQEPEAYLMYGELTPVAFYRNFIHGFFAEHTTTLVFLIATGQLFIALGLVAGKPLIRPAIIGAWIFLLGIAPFGIGSAFPCSLLLAAGLFLVWKRV